jgi:3-oxoacyl-(acyl-carrier-protein) synthase
MSRSVAVTGIGLATPLGTDNAEVWRSLCAGRTAVRPVPENERMWGGVFAGAMISDRGQFTEGARSRSSRLFDRPAALGVAAAELALKDAGLNPATLDPHRTGAFVASPGRTFYERDFTAAVERARDEATVDYRRFGAVGLDLIDPMWLLRGLGNIVLYDLTIRYRALGTSGNFCLAGGGGTVAIGEAFRSIQRGYADVTFAGGYDSLLDAEKVDMFKAAHLIAQTTEDIEAAARPFDRRRNGFALSEGAGFLILEEGNHARSRGARIYGEIVGYASNAAPFDQVSLGPSAAGFAGAIERARDEAECDTVDAVYAHGLATRDADREEARGLRQALGRRSGQAPVTAIKGMLGNTGTAAGAIEAAIAMMSIAAGALPPIMDTLERDSDCDLNFVIGQTALKQSVTAIALSSANLGGMHAALVLRRAA